jgi:hypothetical protein
LIVAAGPVFSDYTTVGWTAQPPRHKLISAEPQVVRFANAEYTGVALADFLSDLAKKVRANDATLVQYQRLKQTVSAPAPVDADAPLSRAELWRQIEADLDSKTTLMVETGISWWDGIYTRLPGGARFEIEMQWGSIGWAVPAAFGYSLGLETDRRLVAAIGDGSFQLTAQEVSNMIRHGQEILIYLVNNRGYVIESAIHDGPYNYYKNWDYAGVAQSVHESAGHALRVGAGAFEGPFDSRLQCASGEALAIAPDEKGDRAGNRDSAELTSSCFSLLALANRTARLSRYASMTDSSSASMGTLRSLPPLPLTWMTADPSSVVRMSPTSAWRSSSARRPASSAVRIIARSRSAQSIWRWELWSCATVSSSASTAVRGRALGRGLASLGRPTNCIGFAASTSPV